MNKLLFVNISGIVFQIDETAYHKLELYLNSIRRKYGTSAEGEEIISDIENRIAELFTAKVGERGAIMENTVDEIINTMGAPEDYEDVSFDAQQHQQQTQQSNQTYERQTATKFYRDKDNNILGGVCAGLAAKFDIDALWIRLLFLVAFFFAGSGFLLYIILWIIIPEAKTTAEKLEMRGEKVDINNIERTVRDGAKQFSSRVQTFGDEVKTTFSKENMDKTRRNTGDFIESSVATIKPVLNTIAKAFSFFVLIVSLIIIVAITVELASNWGKSWADVDFLGNHITEGSQQAWILITAALALVVIPLLGIIISAVKHLLSIKQRTRWISGTLSIMWTIALLVVIYIGITIGKNFQYEGNVSARHTITQPAQGTLYLELETTNLDFPFTAERKYQKSFKKENEYVIQWSNEDSLMFRQVSVSIEKSPDTNFVVLVTKTARGYDRSNAKKNAESFTYTLSQRGDSVLVIPDMITLSKNEPWREQEIELLIRVPADKYIYLDNKLDFYLDKNEYTSDLRDVELFQNKLKMTPSGLKPVY